MLRFPVPGAFGSGGRFRSRRRGRSRSLKGGRGRVGMVRAHGRHSLRVTTVDVSSWRNRFPPRTGSRDVPFPRPEVDIACPPGDLDALIDWFERVSYRLVLLEEYRLDEIRSALDSLDRSVRHHLRSTATFSRRRGPSDSSDEELERLLAADHAWFRTSLDQLWWFFAVVEEDDHGGNRQALGQYGRVLAESLRRHRYIEREYLEASPRNTEATPSPRQNSF